MKTALIFGSSGLIGSHLLDIILQKNKYDKIKLFVRSLPEIYDSRVDIIQTNFTDIEKHKNLINGDDCFFCIGTTRKDTPNKKEYRRVEYEIPVNIAKIAKSNSVNSFIYVSSLGANSKSNGSYLKNKGQVEEQLKNLNFTKLALIRPSILLGNRKTFRLGERIGIFLMKNLSIFFFMSLKKYKPIQAEYVARSMVAIAEKKYDKSIFESDILYDIGKS
tara:strand:+ start:607 stop:1263 length:657 start_codon:yes stop_codon:yes gene_type:complete